MKKIKVLHYIPGFNDGGIESRLLDWYQNIDKTKIEFIVIKFNKNNESTKLKKFTELGGRYYNISNFTFKNIKKYINDIKEIIKSEKPDIVHVHSVSTGIFVLKIAKKYKIKTRIIHSRTTNYLPNEKNTLIKKILRKMTPKYATNYFACSKEAGIWGIGRKYKNKVRVINNGIILDNFKYNEKNRNAIREKYNIDNDTILIGTIGRLSPQKNLFFLLDVFKTFCEENENTKLMIVGDGTLKCDLQKKIDELKLDKKIIFTGQQDNVWDYYMAFDLFICTSYYEGFGTTAIESQATGLPTIISDGFPETVLLTDYIHRLPLNESSIYWSNYIKNIKNRTRTDKDIIKIEKSGFSAKNVAKELQKFYEESIKE